MLLWRCHKALEVWVASGLSIGNSSTQIGSFVDLLWLMKNIQNQEANNIALFAMIAWFLWTSRNEARVRGTRKQAVQIVQWAENYLDEYQIATL